MNLNNSDRIAILKTIRNIFAQHKKEKNIDEKTQLNNFIMTIIKMTESYIINMFTIDVTNGLKNLNENSVDTNEKMEKIKKSFEEYINNLLENENENNKKEIMENIKKIFDEYKKKENLTEETNLNKFIVDIISSIDAYINNLSA